ncbi:alkaline phosphatase family protein [Nevskia soli]|uniref:alkaline phosphatase family protein n=1 Tax=Nevskia soli TaxID=418856 RepID=UPI0004A6E594|nr:alkaline phosphatase family protein [Nevskia soli]
MKKNGFSRRTFLGGSAAAAMVAATQGLAGCGSSSSINGGNSNGAPGDLPDPTRPAGTADDALPFDHVVIVMMENHSFDNYLGMLPLRGQPLADGFMFDDNGLPLNTNPLNGGYQRAFHMPSTCAPNSVTQNWNSSHKQINGGRMDGFAGTSITAMGYWDEKDIPFYYSMAKTFCVGNRCFASAPCQTYPNRRFLYSGTAVGDISTSSDSLSLPYPAGGTLPDILNKYGITWRDYFTDLPNLAVIPQILERNPLNFSPVLQFYLDCAAGTLPAVSFVDSDFGLGPTIGSLLFDKLKSTPNLPSAVAAVLDNLDETVESLGGSEENPQDIAYGEAFVSQVVQAVMASPKWSRTLLVWTYDEHGGYYDHVPPASVSAPDNIPPMLAATDIPGAYNITGMRVPTVVVSPYSKPNAVTNVVHDHTSIIATIRAKWNLPALTYRDAQATTLADFLDLTSPPAFLKPPKLAAPSTPTFGLGGCDAIPQPIIQPMPDALGASLTQATRQGPGQRIVAAHPKNWKPDRLIG